MENNFITTERLQLKPVTIEHCTSVYMSWLNDPEVNKFLESGYYPTSNDDLRDYVERKAKSNDFFLAIHIKENEKHIGNVKIDLIHPVHRTAEFGLMMGDKTEWGKGYAREASLATLNHCFRKLNIRKVNLGVVSGNTNAINLYKSMGFVEEGLFKKHAFHDGEYRDCIRMGLFSEDFI